MTIIDTYNQKEFRKEYQKYLLIKLKKDLLFSLIFFGSFASLLVIEFLNRNGIITFLQDIISALTFGTLTGGIILALYGLVLFMVSRNDLIKKSLSVPDGHKVNMTFNKSNIDLSDNSGSERIFYSSYKSAFLYGKSLLLIPKSKTTNPFLITEFNVGCGGFSFALGEISKKLEITKYNKS